MHTKCELGWTPAYWEWTDRHGVNTEAVYPYEGVAGNHGQHVDTRQMKYRADMSTIKYIHYDPNVSMVNRMLD